ncbi:TlyA family RNA methyltransferase [Cellulosimicrobium arenosum]|uniref:TlyA family RNA methyltransferase n=1 Tax=Cellulosimicrobium arenosum TaxID=2708133 RepID=A0A927IYW3_9MICO|nr:TlyA family RNA methyltransferase [Cellulosimicrobium arenosum]
MGTRVDSELVRRGLARSRRHAAELVAAGRVLQAGAPVPKASTTVASSSELTVVTDDLDPLYASRAGFKLAGVLDALSTDASAGPVGPDPRGARCLDLGASTGGFTDVLLRRGAAVVVAIDVGHDQLRRPLRDDPRVVVREGVNVRDLTPQDVGPAPDLVVADLSFISLAMVLPAVAGVVRPGADLLLLVKPQFEVGRERLGRGGVVRDPELHAEVVLSVAKHAQLAGLRPVAAVPSTLPGPSGNREYFWWLRADGDRPVPERALAHAAREVVARRDVRGADGLADVTRVAANGAFEARPPTSDLPDETSGGDL